MNKTIVPIFFSIDNNYTPFFKIALKSIMDNSSKNNKYIAYVLHCDVSEENQKDVKSMLIDNFECEVINMTEKLTNINDKLFVRDYYSKTTYYRLFIPNMFPQYKKAIYVDSDITVTGDIADMYNYEIGDNLVGAVAYESVQIVPEFIEYVEKYLGIEHGKYFNAGVLLMNLEELRKFNLEDKFISLLNQIKFSVAQDQDYLNVLCKDRVYYLPIVWDKMPFKNDDVKLEDIKLIHYNLSLKPWHYKGILYEEAFFKCVESLGLTDFINEKIESYSEENKQKDYLCGENLKKMAHELSEVEDTYVALVKQGKIKI